MHTRMLRSGNRAAAARPTSTPTTRVVVRAPATSTTADRAANSNRADDKQQRRARPSVAARASADESSNDPNSTSTAGAFDGDAAKSLKEAAALDELIDMLLTARSQQEMAQLVAQNVFAFDTKFWLRVATRADAAPDEPSKERLRAVADSVVVLLDAAMKQTESRLTDSARVLQEVLSAAADADGQWYLPLNKEQVAAVRKAMEERADALDEALLSNAFAWIRKCNEDGLDSMAQLIQKVLQLYAARALASDDAAAANEQLRREQEAAGYLPANSRDQAAARVLEEVIAAEEHEWEGIIERSATDVSSSSDGGPLAEAAFADALQRKMEATVLGLTSGSYAQRVQAEYLKEIEGRARSVFRRLAGAA
jgi:hypothetical protein